eukprot:scaffold285723_cov19-Prasinocladus_malaysianus.AAC.1
MSLTSKMLKVITIGRALAVIQVMTEAMAVSMRQTDNVGPSFLSSIALFMRTLSEQCVTDVSHECVLSLQASNVLTCGAT